jgi:hypothetical protein
VDRYRRISGARWIETTRYNMSIYIYADAKDLKTKVSHSEHDKLL